MLKLIMTYTERLDDNVYSTFNNPYQSHTKALSNTNNVILFFHAIIKYDETNRKQNKIIHPCPCTDIINCLQTITKYML